MPKTPVRLTLEYHLERVIWQDTPEGVRLDAKKTQALMAAATPDQKRRAEESLAAKVAEVNHLMRQFEKGAG